MSLLANLVATTTDKRQPKRSQHPSYLWREPDIGLATHGAQTVMTTAAGHYRLDQSAAMVFAEAQGGINLYRKVMSTEQGEV
jgi:hypothetical protein